MLQQQSAMRKTGICTELRISPSLNATGAGEPVIFAETNPSMTTDCGPYESFGSKARRTSEPPVREVPVRQQSA